MATRRLRLLLRRRAPKDPAADACLRLRTLAVRPQWRRRGVATALVDAFIRAAAERDIHQVRASTRQTNEAARAFYERRGWRRSESDDDEFVDYSLVVAPRHRV